MTTAIDTNVLIALWHPSEPVHRSAQNALDAALARGSLVISAPVFAELTAAPARDATFVHAFCADTAIRIDWNLTEPVWRLAALAFQSYVSRHRKQLGTGPRRILAHFLIGAHADYNGYRLLTLDDRLYRAAFPKLALISV